MLSEPQTHTQDQSIWAFNLVNDYLSCGFVLKHADFVERGIRKLKMTTLSPLTTGFFSVPFFFPLKKLQDMYQRCLTVCLAI